MNILRKIKRAADLSVYPERCPYCGKVIYYREYACEECKADFPDAPVVSYVRYGYFCVAPFEYKGKFAEAVKSFKFNDNPRYAKPLAFMLVQAILESGEELEFDYITYVPMHPKQLAERRYNQSELLAREVAELTGFEVVDAIEKYKENKVQHTLSGKARMSNVKGVYRIIKENKPMLKGKTVLLIDDIVTTGSTLGECAGILEKAGCKSVYCAAVCNVE